MDNFTISIVGSSLHSYKLLSPSCYPQVNNKSVIRLQELIYIRPACVVIHLAGKPVYMCYKQLSALLSFVWLLYCNTSYTASNDHNTSYGTILMSHDDYYNVEQRNRHRKTCVGLECSYNNVNNYNYNYYDVFPIPLPGPQFNYQ